MNALPPPLKYSYLAECLTVSSKNHDVYPVQVSTFVCRLLAECSHYQLDHLQRIAQIRAESVHVHIQDAAKLIQSVLVAVSAKEGPWRDFESAQQAMREGQWESGLALLEKIDALDCVERIDELFDLYQAAIFRLRLQARDEEAILLMQKLQKLNDKVVLQLVRTLTLGYIKQEIGACGMQANLVRDKLCGLVLLLKILPREKLDQLTRDNEVCVHRDSFDGAVYCFIKQLISQALSVQERQQSLSDIKDLATKDGMDQAIRQLNGLQNPTTDLLVVKTYRQLALFCRIQNKIEQAEALEETARSLEGRVMRFETIKYESPQKNFLQIIFMLGDMK